MFRKKVTLGSSKLHGTGVTADENIDKGEEIYFMSPKERRKISIKEILKWGKSKRDDFIKYSFQAGKNHYYKMARGDISYYMNHSCDPNCWYLGQHKILARKYIPRGTELTIDYATITSPSGLEEESFRCKCDSRLCRKKITKHDGENKDIQKKYRGHFLPFIEKMLSLSKSDGMSAHMDGNVRGMKLKM